MAQRKATVLAEIGEEEAEERDVYTAANVFRTPPAVPWARLRAAGWQSRIDRLFDDAMVAIEWDDPVPKGLLPKDYARPSPYEPRLPCM